MPSDDPLPGRALDRFRALPPGDRRALLACLEPAERVRLRARLARSPRGGATLPYADDIVARITAPPTDAAMTAAGRAALARLVEQRHPVPPPMPDSLADRLFGWLFGGRQR